MKSSGHALVLIPWHIGDSRDVTLNAIRWARRLRCFLAEDPDLSRRQFASLTSAAGKRFLRIPDQPDPVFLKTVLGLLKDEDVGLVSGGGIPCFIDPGAWLVRELRRRGAPIMASAGASCLSTVLSLSGIEWRDGRNQVFSFAFFPDGPRAAQGRDRFLEAAARAEEPLVVFLDVKRFRECLKALSTVVGGRRVSVFFDLTKVPRERFPYADRVRTMTCRAWLKEHGRMRWERVSDVALLVHPRGDLP